MMSMGGSGKGGGGGSESQMTQLLKDLTGETKPIRDILGSQYQEALTTGGVGAQIPLITAMQEQSRMGTSKALRGTEDQLSQQGLARTPWGASTMAGVRQQGEMATSLIPSQVAQGYVGNAPSYAMAPVGAMIGGAGNLNTNATNADVAKGNQNSQMMTGLMSAAAAAGAAAMMS